MRDSRPQALDVLFDDASASKKSPLHLVQQRAIALLKLDRAVKGILPAKLQPHCRVANYRGGILVLETTNGSWMTHLRYERTNLLSTLRAEILPSLSSIDIRINPDLMVKNAKHAHITQLNHPDNKDKLIKHRELTQESANSLRGLAAQSPDKLRHIIERFATLAKKK